MMMQPSTASHPHSRQPHPLTCHRPVDGCKSSEPQALSPCKTLLYIMAYDSDRDTTQRGFMDSAGARQLAEVMFGYQGQVSERKAALIAVAAAGTGALQADNDYVDRLLRCVCGGGRTD
jgi:hypothetical protein